MIATTPKPYLKVSSITALGILLSLFGIEAKASTTPVVGNESTVFSNEIGAENIGTEQPAQAQVASVEVAEQTVEGFASEPAGAATNLSDASALPRQLSNAHHTSSVSQPNLSNSSSLRNVPEVTFLNSPLMQPEVADSFDALLPSAQFSDVVVAQSLDDTFSPQSESEIRQQLLIDPNLSPAEIRTGNALDRPRAVPSSNFLTPSAYGADWGDAYIGVSGATVDNDREFDGSISVGVGLGNAVNNVGVELSASIISLDGFAEDGIAGAKLHKVFPGANNLALAVGWANPIKWGAADRQEDTFYGVATQQYDIRPGKENPMPVTASLGVGTGAFRSTGAIAADDNAPNVFGSLGLRFIPEVSVSTSWTGSALGLALSTAPFDAPLVITAGVADLTDNTENGTQFVGSVGYSFGF